MDSSLGGNVRIYLINQDGLTVYSQSIGDNIDSQLIGGLGMAILNFSGEVYGSGMPDFVNVKSKIGHELIETRLMTGEKVHSLLLLKNVNDLDSIAYFELDELSKLIINHVESDYSLDILNKNSLSSLNDFVNEHIMIMKEQIYSSYLLKILTTAINYGVKVRDSSAIIPLVNKAYLLNNPLMIHESNNKINHSISVMACQKHSKTFKGIINQVNKTYESVWSLFKVPLITLF